MPYAVTVVVCFPLPSPIVICVLQRECDIGETENVVVISNPGDDDVGKVVVAEAEDQGAPAPYKAPRLPYSEDYDVEYQYYDYDSDNSDYRSPRETKPTGR